jgi:hypothetical protein
MQVTLISEGFFSKLQVTALQSPDTARFPMAPSNMPKNKGSAYKGAALEKDKQKACQRQITLI